MIAYWTTGSKNDRLLLQHTITAHEVRHLSKFNTQK